jgi:hypothetical protein
MKIKILSSVAGTNFAYKSGDIVTLPRKEAMQFVKANLAIVHDESDEPVENATLSIPQRAIKQTRKALKI